MIEDNKKSFFKFWLPVIIYAIIIFWGSSQEQPFGMDLKADGLDKILHIAEYAVLGFLVSRAIAHSAEKVSVATLVFMMLVIGIFYGLTDEFHQSFTPGRDFSFLDLAADAIGSFLGAVTFVAFTPLEKKVI